MKFFIFLSIISITQFTLQAQIVASIKKTTIYLVRHAEKEEGKDPLLTTKGQQRAGDLMRILKSKNLQDIYVTQYRRTQMTGDSIRIQLGIDTIHYLADTTGEDLLQKINVHPYITIFFLSLTLSNQSENQSSLQWQKLLNKTPLQATSS